MTTAGRDTSARCARVLDRLVEAGEVTGDAELEGHLGSCMTCFRVLSELRDAPRLATVLRQEAREAAVASGRDERFWSDAAERTVDAVMAALPVAAAPRPARVRRVARAAAAVGLLAAAAMCVLVVGGRPPASKLAAPAAAAPGFAVGYEIEDEVAELDAAALQRLVDRLRGVGGGELAALAGDGNDAGETPADDDARVSDALAELDRAALVRVERSLTGSAL